MKRWLALLAVLAGLIGAQPAAASELVELDVASRFVDPAEEPPAQTRTPTLKANVLLPDGYAAASERGYPVLYLLHGATGNYRSWAESMHAADVADDFPGIIVMPDGGAFGMYTDWYNGGAFGRPAWQSYHLIELRREIERRYAIRPGRRWHAVAGLSMGGMGAMRYAAALPGYFGSAASFSGAALDTQAPEVAAVIDSAVALVSEGTTFADIWGPPGDYYATATNPQQLIPNLRSTRLYVTVGDGLACPGDAPITAFVLEAALRVHAKAFVAAARALGIDVTHVETCGDHGDVTGQRAFAKALEWNFFGKVPRQPRSWTYITASPRGEMHDLRFRFNAQPTTVIRFERDGAVLRGEGSGTVRIRRGRRCVIDVTLPFEIEVPRHCER